MKYIKKFQTLIEATSYAENNPDIKPNVLYASIEKQFKFGSLIDKTIPTGSYSVVLNNEWRLSTSIPNPNTSQYDGVYESFSNYHYYDEYDEDNGSFATMYIDIEGYKDFYLYIRSYAESSFDYVMVSNLDMAFDEYTEYDNSAVKSHTRSNQRGGTDIKDYKLVKFNNIEEGVHRITITYRKDGSVDSNDDRGYILIPTDQEALHNEIINRKTISFTIFNGETDEMYGEYEAEPGMTWEDWCSSDYNSDGWYYDDMEMCLFDRYSSYYMPINDYYDEIESGRTYYASPW